MTVYLEDLREGSEYLSASRTISSQDITAFAGLSGDFSRSTAVRQDDGNFVLCRHWRTPTAR
jgi:hypothetical protein